MKNKQRVGGNPDIINGKFEIYFDSNYNTAYDHRKWWGKHKYCDPMNFTTKKEWINQYNGANTAYQTQMLYKCENPYTLNYRKREDQKITDLNGKNPEVVIGGKRKMKRTKRRMKNRRRRCTFRNFATLSTLPRTQSVPPFF